MHQKHCQTIFNKMPDLLSKHFKYASVDPSTGARALKIALTLLKQAGLVYPVYQTALTGLPLNSHINPKKIKLLFLDLGLIKAAGKIEVNTLLNENFHDVRQGALAEQFVGQELISYQVPHDHAALFYWSKDKRGSQAEIDYVIHHEEKIIPIEVKAGHTGRLKSLHQCLALYHFNKGIRISTAPLSLENNILTLPFY